MLRPHLSGRVVRRAIAERYPGVPVLYVSGYPGDEIEGRGWQDDGAPFLQKPFTSGELVRRSGELLDDAALRS